MDVKEAGEKGAAARWGGRLTKVQAIVELGKNLKLFEDEHSFNWGMIYDWVAANYPQFTKSKHWKAGIRGVVYREIRNGKTFKKVGAATFSLK